MDLWKYARVRHKVLGTYKKMLDYEIRAMDL